MEPHDALFGKSFCWAVLVKFFFINQHAKLCSKKLRIVMIVNGTFLARRFTVRRALGQGGIASIYLATDEILKTEVALKVLHPHLKRQTLVFERFKREVAITRQIQHPGVIRIFDLVETSPGDVFLVMEYLPGGDLKGRILDHGPLSIQEVVRLGLESLAALSAAHRLGIIHRDIKPHNILFDGEDKIRITDFGLARSGTLPGLTTHTQVAGTPEYLAPEMAELHHVDARADLYALGITLYEAVTGQLPFFSNSPYQTIKMQVEQKPKSPQEINAEIPAGLQSVILRALEKDPGDRFQSAEEFSQALETLAVLPPPAKVDLHECPQCRAEVLDVFPYCFACGREPLLLSQAQKGEQKWKVIVTGPGKPADKLSHEQRFQCLGLIKDMNVDPKRLSGKIPRLPFVILDDLEKNDAHELKHRLELLGLEAVALSYQDRALKKSIRGLTIQKIKKMTVRYYAVILGSMGGIWAQVGNLGLYLFLIVGLILMSIPVYCGFRFRLPEVTWTSSRRKPMKTLLALARKLTNPALQSITRRIVGKGAILRQTITQANELPADLKKQALEAIDRNIQNSITWLELAQRVDVLLHKFDEKTLYQKISSLDHQITTATSLEHTDELMKQSFDLRADLEENRSLEQSRELLFDRLLTLSSRLDALAIRLAMISSYQAQNVLQDILHLTTDLQIETDAMDEIERLLRGE
ncbi:serine/threonine protein kinase [candidate division CSSED10-310 bacterium]|uniref:Serine/threonine protein kinase n=1 Tax=candidate division CSSED10-310 bacterium TaxID=2855610 RepID=A0ABV6YYS8_UNCC1